jgi:cell division transport system ATP-binding protein
MQENIIDLQHVNIYQGNNLVLQDVNFRVQKGEFVYLVGKTGTGKSSLLKTMYGDLRLKEGDGTVVGFNLRDMDWKKYRSCVVTWGWFSRIFNCSPIVM